MKSFAAACLLLLAAAVPALAQSPDEAAVARQMDALSKAIIAVDTAALQKLTLPELSYGHSAGRIENQAQFVEALVTKKSIITSADNSKMTTSIVGDLAISRGHITLGVMSTGTPTKSELDYLMIWKKVGGEWRLLARQAYKV
jgi:Domain of unknown function (DUF4440)